MALTVQGWGSKKKKVTTTGGRELLAKRRKEKEERDSRKTTRPKTIRGEKVTQTWDNKAKKWVTNSNKLKISNKNDKPLNSSKKLKDDYKPGDLTKNPTKAVYSPSLGHNVTGANIKAKAAKDREEMLAKEEREKRHNTLLHKTKKQDAAKTQLDELAAAKKKLKRHASGKNSVAKTQLQLKIRTLENNKKKKKGG